ncbi:MAG: Fe-S cluster assembly protein SufD [Bacteroidetes bacterium]|nr:Fe-S cluster assembly protein SufD [Bacteroidota bacterium]
MNSVEYFKEKFDLLQHANKDSLLGSVHQQAFNAFRTMGIPSVKHEEWKYTRVGSLFNKEYNVVLEQKPNTISEKEINAVRLPGHEEANELFFINGIFSFGLSKILSSKQLVVISLKEAAAGEYNDVVSKNFNHSSNYLKDGVNALNAAFAQEAVFIHIKKGQITEHPVYIYNITDTRSGNTFSQPRSLIHVAENAQVQMVETYIALGHSQDFTSQVTEIIVEKDAHVEYYKIQHEGRDSSMVSTTHLRQVGKSYTHTVTVSLDGDIVRNNLNVVLDAEHCEAHLYGLYFQKGSSHIDNHTVVDNVKPNCFSNELYKGIIDGDATGVFNGKIFVQPHAQKTNAYQSNKNILLSDSATVNTKPQLEIFADDVKCSHGCTIGRLDEEGLFYLQSRGISEKTAMALLLHAFSDDILSNIKLPAIKNYVDELIEKRLEM